MSRVWLDGRLVHAADAAVSVHDRGFTLGDGLFETMRAYGRRVFRLGAHLERLERGAARIGLPLPPALAHAVQATLDANRLADAAVRLTVSRGAGAGGLAPGEHAAPTVVVTTRPYLPEPAWYTRGLRAVVASGCIGEFRPSAGLKQLGYLDHVLALREARAAGADDALLLDSAGHLAEGAASNIFLVEDGALHTPPLSCGILAGITRATVLELAARRGLPVHEEPLAPERLAWAEEAFLTSSLREIVPLVAVDGAAVGGGQPGALTLSLLADYRALTRPDG